MTKTKKIHNMNGGGTRKNKYTKKNNGNYYWQQRANYLFKIK